MALDDAPPRYAPRRSFPSYAFIPGQHPHPTRDPDGHSFGQHSPPRFVPAAAWRESEDYLFGIDLFNAGYLWESHESWEGLWMEAKTREPRQGDLLRGLIQLAAASLKVLMAQPLGLERLTRTGAGHLEAVAASGEAVFMGLALRDCAAAFRAFAAARPASLVGRPRLRLSGLLSGGLTEPGARP